MPSIHNIIHQVASDVVGRHLSSERLGAGHNNNHISGYDVQDVRGIIRVEYLRSHSLLMSPANNAFAYSYNISGVNTFPGIQIINANNVRVDQVHGLGDITHQAGGGSSYDCLITRWQGGNRAGIYTAVVNALNINYTSDVDLAILAPNDGRYVQEMLSLFCVELGRSPSSLVTTAMFYELYSQGYDALNITTPIPSTQDVPDVFYPMARKEAVPQFRKIYDVTFSGFAFNIRYVYDQGHPQSGAIDAKRMLLAEARCAAVWYNLFGKNNISSDDLQFDQSLLDAQVRALPSNFAGIRTQDDQQEEDFRKAISDLGTRIYGLPLEGLGEDDVNIGWIHAHFGKYTMDALVQILSLRMNSSQLHSIQILPGIFVDPVMNNMARLNLVFDLHDNIWHNRFPSLLPLYLLHLLPGFQILTTQHLVTSAFLAAFLHKYSLASHACRYSQNLT